MKNSAIRIKKSARQLSLLLASGALFATYSPISSAFSSVPPEDFDLLSADKAAVSTTYESSSYKAKNLFDNSTNTSWSNYWNETYFNDSISIDFKNLTAVNSV
ncbi:MAG: hypothetical protein P1U57_10805, partial [Oleibacter sp.]|nr:hypothetical protein [Thalassolituus sp.]